MRINNNNIEFFSNGVFSKAHWVILSKLTRLDYLSINFLVIELRYFHAWYDGQHHRLYLGLISINWGGYPIIDL